MGALAQSDQATNGRLAETRPRHRPEQGRRPRSATQRPASWNVLAEELVSFPPMPLAGRRLEQGYGNTSHSRRQMIGAQRSTARPFSDTCPSQTIQVSQLFQPAPSIGSIDRAVVRTPQARPRQGYSRPQGWQRLLPGAATLVVLASLWFGAGALSNLHRSAMSVPASATRVQGGYLYVARPGDTLWSIASKLQPGGDPRPLVAQLEQQLHGAELVAGDELKLP